jgi:hypothetical protein
MLVGATEIVEQRLNHLPVTQLAQGLDGCTPHDRKGIF